MIVRVVFYDRSWNTARHRMGTCAPTPTRELQVRVADHPYRAALDAPASRPDRPRSVTRDIIETCPQMR